MALSHGSTTEQHRHNSMVVQSETKATNSAESSVSELASALKRTLEDNFSYVRVRGEISGYKGTHASGHAYFSLKDQNARLDAIIWRTSFSRLKFKPEDGLEVVVSGRITTFAGKSSYQIVIEALEPAGAGALMALLEERRRQLSVEGLFNPDRKRPLPFLPSVVGVITSPTGAVIRDIIHRLAARYPTRVIVWPVRVQGDGSAQDIASAIEGFGSVPFDGPVPRPDVLIVARGGGSLEDLWAFNQEIVVRAAAQSAIPLISAVGHETDWTLIDHAADLRAPTPTAAAELCAPIRHDLQMRVEHSGTRALDAISRRAQDCLTYLQSAARALPSFKTLLLLTARRLDSQVQALNSILRKQARDCRSRLTRLSGALERRSPKYQLVRWHERTIAIRSNLAYLRVSRAASCRQWLQRSNQAFLATVRTVSNRRRERHGSLQVRWQMRIADRRQAPERLRYEVIRSEYALQRAVRAAVQRQRLASVGVAHIFAALNHYSILGRGYALVLGRNGVPLTNVAAAEAAKTFAIQFADGKLYATSMSRARPKPRRRRPSSDDPNLLL